MQMRTICLVSGGKSSAWCADWAVNNIPKENLILMFNDTKWEHPDLYRFLDDLQNYFDRPILECSDGRSPEELFREKKLVATDLFPFCSIELKGKPLQDFYQDGDTILFGIDRTEMHRAERIVKRYQLVATQTGKWPIIRFPMIENSTTPIEVGLFFDRSGIRIPLLYELGFGHNNCSGGCVRAGRYQWKLLLEKLPGVYDNRERVEIEISELAGRQCSYLKNMTLKELRGKLRRGYMKDYKYNKEEDITECLGVCLKYG